MQGTLSPVQNYTVAAETDGDNTENVDDTGNTKTLKIGKKKLKQGQLELARATKDPLAQTRETVTEIPDTVNPSKETP